MKVGPLSVRQWTWLLAVASVAVQLYLSYLATAEFRQGAYDLGITIQGFSNVGGGRFFWSTGNHLHHGTVSLLNSHFSWVYFAVYPVYTAIPGAFTLFVVQATAIGIAVVPLEALTTESTGSARRGLIVAFLYAIWAPMYAGMPNSFHLEAFLPVLFFALVLVWIRRQYALGLGLAVLAGFTIDVAPILTALVALVFLSYPLQVLYRRARHRTAESTTAHSEPPQGDRRPVRDFLSSPGVRACLALVAVSVVVFLVMRLLEANLTNWLGIPGSSLGVFRNPGSALSNVTVQLGQKVEFWVIMGATVGFLPLLYPRILIVLLPWIGYTALQAGNGWFSFPSHYVAIAAVPLFLGVALGIRDLPLPDWPIGQRLLGRVSEPASKEAPAADASIDASVQDSIVEARAWRRRRSTAGWLGAGPSPSGATTAQRRRAWRQSKKSRLGLAGATFILGAVAVNIVISPVNFVMSGLLASTGSRLFVSSSSPYGLAPLPPPGYAYVERLAEVLPPDALVLVQQPLFPLVAHDPNAYIFASLKSQGYVEREPFNNSTPPQYVFSTISGSRQFNQLVANLSEMVWDRSIYGLIGWVQNTPIGSVFLFEEGYTGPTEVFGPITYPVVTFTPGHHLLKGSNAYWKWVENSTFRRVLAISSPANETGQLWSAKSPGPVLPAGDYNLVVDVRANGNRTTVCQEIPQSAVLFEISGNSSAESSILSASIEFNQTSGCNTWTQLTLPFSLDQPVTFVAFTASRPPYPLLGVELVVTQVSVVPSGGSDT